MLLAVHYRVMEHLGSLESSQEARVAFGYRLGKLLRFFRALQTSRVLYNSIVHANSMNQFLKRAWIQKWNEHYKSLWSLMIPVRAIHPFWSHSLSPFFDHWVYVGLGLYYTVVVCRVKPILSAFSQVHSHLSGDLRLRNYVAKPTVIRRQNVSFAGYWMESETIVVFVRTEKYGYWANIS